MTKIWSSIVLIDCLLNCRFDRSIMAHAQLLGTIGEPGTLSRKQPLQIELNGRLLTLEEYEQLIRLSKQSPNPSSVGNHRPPQSPPTPKTSGAPDERLGSNRTNNGVADNVCGSTNRPDSNDVGPRRTINTITIKTVCTSATPIEKQAINGGLNRPTTTATLINTSSASPGSINNSSPKVFRHTASSSDTKRNNASSSSACIDTPVAATSDRNSRSAVTESLIDSSHLESTAATKQSVQVTRETLRETVHKIPLDQSKTDKTNDLTTTINNPMQAGFVAPTYYTQPFRVAAPRDPASSGSQNVSKVKTGTLRPDDTNRPLSHHAVYRSANQPASSSTTTPVVSYRINPQAHFAAHRQSTDLSAQAITSRFAYGQTPSTAETESNVASGHVQQQIDRLSARLQQQPQLRKSYEKLVQQKHTLTTATCTDGVHEQPRMRQVVEQQMRYADHWNQPAPVTEHRFEQTIEKRLPNGAIDRQVSRQSERNVLPASNADDRQSYLCTSLDGPDLRLNPSRAQRVREELNSDRFVQELRTRIANGSSCTSSPTVAAGRSATLDRKRTSNTAVVNAARSRSVERNKSSVTAKHLATTGTSSFDSSAVGLQSSRDTVDRSVRIGVGSPGGSLATPIVRKTPQEVSQLSQLPPGARYSYACSRNVNGWSEMDDQWIDSNNQLNHNMTGDSSRVSDETLNVSKPSIELESDAAATFRKRDKYGFFVDQSQSSASPNTLRRK